MSVTQLASLEAREVFPGYQGRFVHTPTMTFAYWTVAPGAAVPAHAHAHEQVVNVLEGEYELTVDGTTTRLTPGTVVAIPSNATHAGVAVTPCRILDVFHPCRDDYR